MSLALDHIKTKTCICEICCTHHRETRENCDQFDTQKPHDEHKAHEQIGEEENVKDFDQDDHDAHELDGLGDDKDPRVVVRRVAVPFEVPDEELRNINPKNNKQIMKIYSTTNIIVLFNKRLQLRTLVTTLRMAKLPSTSGMATR